AASGRPPGGEEGVAQHPQQVAEIVLGVQPARLAQNLRKGLLHKILGLLTRAAQRPGGPVEPVYVVAERVGVELMFRSHPTVCPAPAGPPPPVLSRGRSGSELRSRSRSRPHVLGGRPDQPMLALLLQDMRR